MYLKLMFISYIIEDKNGRPITSMVEHLKKLNADDTIHQLTTAVLGIFLETDYREIAVKAISNEEKVMMYIDKHAEVVDDAHISLGDYVSEKISALVTGIHRKLGAEHE